MGQYFVLDENHQIVNVGNDIHRWGKFFESKERIVEQTYVGVGRDWWVSTVFLGIDHSFRMGGPPLFFETMVFWHGNAPIESEWIEYQERWSTWDEAKTNHARIVAELSAVVGQTDAAEAEAIKRLQKNNKEA